MSLGNSLGNAIRAATSGVPRLYAAARGSGAGHRDALGMVAAWYSADLRRGGTRATLTRLARVAEA